MGLLMMPSVTTPAPEQVVRLIFVSDVVSLGCQDNFLKRDGDWRVNVLVIIQLMARI